MTCGLNGLLEHQDRIAGRHGNIANARQRNKVEASDRRFARDENAGSAVGHLAGVGGRYRSMFQNGLYQRHRLQRSVSAHALILIENATIDLDRHDLALESAGTYRLCGPAMTS